VLGSPNDEHGNLHSIAIERCECALRLHRDNPGWRLLLTGGFGAHFNTTGRPHAEYLRDYLGQRGVPTDSFLPTAPSQNTVEDASLSKPIAVAAGTRVVAVVTSDYHVARARWVFRREFADTDITLLFVATETNEGRCRLDLAALRAHEREALAMLEAATPPAPEARLDLRPAEDPPL
jgi:uncharacterized SAM-binding protein YcdF (DUF218 family)